MPQALTKSQFKVISSLLLDIGKFVLIALVIGFFLPQSSVDPRSFLGGSFISAFLLGWGIILARKEDIL